MVKRVETERWEYEETMASADPLGCPHRWLARRVVARAAYIGWSSTIVMLSQDAEEFRKIGLDIHTVAFASVQGPELSLFGGFNVYCCDETARFSCKEETEKHVLSILLKTETDRIRGKIDEKTAKSLDFLVNSARKSLKTNEKRPFWAKLGKSRVF